MTTYNVAELAQTLFEEAGDTLFLFDPETEQLLDVNPMVFGSQQNDQNDKVDVLAVFPVDVQGFQTV